MGSLSETLSPAPRLLFFFLCYSPQTLSKEGKRNFLEKIQSSNSSLFVYLISLFFPTRMVAVRVVVKKKSTVVVVPAVRR